MRNQEKMKKRMFFDRFYWLKVTVLLKKKPTCFPVGFLWFFRGMKKFFNYMKNKEIFKKHFV
ncbi:hypothetical protein BJI62_19330 [Acinetobacter pittii]|nr:hypothetical protein BJI62_19330 [Acinetobacter pittii]